MALKTSSSFTVFLVGLFPSYTAVHAIKFLFHVWTQKYAFTSQEFRENAFMATGVPQM